MVYRPPYVIIDSFILLEAKDYIFLVIKVKHYLMKLTSMIFPKTLGKILNIFLNQ